MKHITHTATLLTAMAITGLANAGELVYQPINPSFGGDPFNSSHLLQTAQIQNKHQDDGTDFGSLFEEPTAADKFADALQSTMIAGSAEQLSNAIFEDGAPPSGNFSLDGAMVTYDTINGRVIVKISDGINTNTIDIPKPNTE